MVNGIRTLTWLTVWVRSQFLTNAFNDNQARLGFALSPLSSTTLPREGGMWLKQVPLQHFW